MEENKKKRIFNFLPISTEHVPPPTAPLPCISLRYEHVYNALSLCAYPFLIQDSCIHCELYY